MEVSFTLNGRAAVFTVHPGELLLPLLRREGLWSVHHGCDTGDCGACTVLVDGIPRVTCILLAAQVHGRSVVTLEQVGTPDALHPVQQAFVNRGAVQCGYCIPGMILSAINFLAQKPEPNWEDAREALSGHLCRCTGYLKPVDAVLAAAKTLRRR